MADRSIPATADDVDHDFDATASPPPGSNPVKRLGLLARALSDESDPGHLAEDDEWAKIVARAEGRS